MILSMDLNPVLKRKYFLDNMELNDINIPSNLIYGPGGDGIELAYLLSGLGEDVLISGFLGGVNGGFIRKDLEDASIPHEFLQIKDETSDNIIISMGNKEEIIIGAKLPRITRDELGGFYELYNQILPSIHLNCFVGSLPINVPKEIYFDLITNGNKVDRKTLLAVKGEELYYGIEAMPYLVLMDKNELENLTKLSLDYEYEIIKAGQYILEKGVSIVVITLGSKGSIILTEDFIYRVEVPNVEVQSCKINYGYMIGGFALAIKRNYDFDMMLKIGQACGSINCFKHREGIDMSDIKRIMGSIEITKFNY